MNRPGASGPPGGTGAQPAPSGAARRAIRQQRPFRTASQEASLSLLIAAERLRRRVADLVEPHGITMQQYNVLRILRGSHPEPLPTLEIAGRMIEATPGITRLLDRLEEKGWVRRVRCATDRRQVHCSITAEGLELLAALDPVVDALDDELAQVLDDEDTATLIALLDRVIDACPPR